MIQRTEERGAPIEWAGQVIVPVTRTWRLAVSSRFVRFAWVYRRAARLEVAGGADQVIPDHVMRVQVGWLMVAALGWVAGRSSR